MFFGFNMSSKKQKSEMTKTEGKKSGMKKSMGKKLAASESEKRKLEENNLEEKSEEEKLDGRKNYVEISEAKKSEAKKSETKKLEAGKSASKKSDSKNLESSHSESKKSASKKSEAKKSQHKKPEVKKHDLEIPELRNTRRKRRLPPDIIIKQEEDLTVEVKLSLDPCDYEVSKPFACNVCQKCFRKKADLRKHERIHTGEKPYECQICFKAFAIAGNLSKHRAVHSTERPYKCKICDKSYKQQKHLKSHLDIHSGVKKFHCDICGKDFVHSWSWHCHMSNHSGVFKYKCNVCDKGFNISTDYKRHVFVHGGERPLKCDFCENRFAHSTLLRRHIAIHHTARNLKCNRCEKVFDLLSDFKAHKLTHKGEKHLKCEFCLKGFGKLSHLKRHYKVHINKPALCSVCKKSFRTKEELLSHTETHIDILNDQEEIGNLDKIITDSIENVNPNEVSSPVDNGEETSPNKAMEYAEETQNLASTSSNVRSKCVSNIEYLNDESDIDDSVSLSDVTSDTEEKDISDDNEELDEYEVCTVCKKVLTSEREFLTHMQAHIIALNEMEEIEAKRKADEIDQTPNGTEDIGESFESNCVGEDSFTENADDDDDDDVICTKITNEVTGTIVVFHKEDKSHKLDDSSVSVAEQGGINSRDNSDGDMNEERSSEKYVLLGCTPTEEIDDNEFVGELNDCNLDESVGSLDLEKLQTTSEIKMNIMKDGLEFNVVNEEEGRDGFSSHESFEVKEEEVVNEMEEEEDGDGDDVGGMTKQENAIDGESCEVREDMDGENGEQYETIALSSINDYQLTTSAEIVNGNLLISIAPEGEVEYSKDIGMSDDILFAEKVNGDDHFLDGSAHLVEDENERNAIRNPQAEDMILNDKIELDLSSISNNFVGDCSQIMDDENAHTNELEMGIPWVEYAMKADDR